MRSGTCPRCGGTEIFTARNAIAIGDDTQPAVHQHIDQDFRGMRRRIPADLWWFTCAGCGLLQSFLLDDAARDFVQEAWIRLPPPGP